MKGKKTIKVLDLLNMANNYLENSHDDASESRKALACFVANILHDTHNYEGFNYLDSESDLHAGHYGRDGRIFFYKPF